MKNMCQLLIAIFISSAAILGAQELSPEAKAKAKVGRVETPAPTHPPLQPVDITKLPEGTEQLDLYLLMGQSNMKGRGIMPEESKRDPRMVMMHLKDDSWYLARHPLHLAGDAKTFAGHGNEGVGPGLTFAEALISQNPKIAIGLVPCALGGSPINLWQKGGKLYEEALRRAMVALQTTAPVKARIRGVLWVQGEANANAAGLAVHEAKLLKLVDDLRADLAQPDLPFIACTIGEMGDIRDENNLADAQAMNQILLALSSKRASTACVDARDLHTHIGDRLHYDTAAQNEIGKRFAAKLKELRANKSPGSQPKDAP
ncbi:MAG: sialate O-acetylesterase [Akkermansiaceae bacterium]|nr:sialate O-acetylesterase [Akkermansiaceae bacterium]